MTRKSRLRTDATGMDSLRPCVFAPKAGGGGRDEKLVEGLTSPCAVFIRDTPEYVDEFFTRATSLWVTDTVFCWPHIGRGEELFAEGDTVAFTIWRLLPPRCRCCCCCFCFCLIFVLEDDPHINRGSFLLNGRKKKQQFNALVPYL